MRGEWESLKNVAVGVHHRRVEISRAFVPKHINRSCVVVGCGYQTRTRSVQVRSFVPNPQPEEKDSGRDSLDERVWALERESFLREGTLIEGRKSAILEWEGQLRFKVLDKVEAGRWVDWDVDMDGRDHAHLSGPLAVGRRHSLRMSTPPHASGQGHWVALMVLWYHGSYFHKVHHGDDFLSGGLWMFLDLIEFKLRNETLGLC